jgi:hypothetical protein
LLDKRHPEGDRDLSADEVTPWSVSDHDSPNEAVPVLFQTYSNHFFAPGD